MKKVKGKRLLSFAVVLCMLLSNVLIAPVASAESGTYAAQPYMENENQEDGIILRKSAQPDGNGNVDITIEAYTTGTVQSHSTSTPTDVVLALDVSGSMSDRQEGISTTEYNPVTGSDYTDYYWVLFVPVDYDCYGFDSNQTYYVKDANDVYIPVTHSGRDDNNYDIYYSNTTSQYYYPILDITPTDAREHAYPVVQFYRATTQVTNNDVKLDVLKDSVNRFLASTADKNATITDPDKKHRVSIVKFAGDRYYNSTSSDATAANALLPANIGDNKYNSNSYNYTQVVADLTVVDSSNLAAMQAAVNGLDAGGTTAIDYGMELAQHVLWDRDASEVADKNEVVILFTDGVPTHSNSYEDDVAGRAINYANGLSKAGTAVYTISMESHADAAQEEVADYEGNAFMHYLSSNFPDATANTSTWDITKGAGSISNGYYLTPNADMSLDMIFDKISQNIDSPTIPLGATATVHDHISPYFDLATGTLANDVKVYTADYDGNGGWDNPIPVDPTEVIVSSEDGVSAIEVKGFNFDENFISREPRNTDFYGKKLIITIKVKPDQAAIDAAADTIKASGGYVETNKGNALVKNSSGTNVAEVHSPSIKLSKVTYKVDGDVYDEYFLLPTYDHTVIAEPTKEGHTFSGWDRTGTFTLGEDDVEIVGTFSVNQYKVTYKYNVSPKPAGWPDIPDDYNQIGGMPIMHDYGSEVTVKEDLSDIGLSVAGYNFRGWRMADVDVTTLGGTDSENFTSFIMPAKDVELIAHFEPDTDTVYSVEHWLEYIDGVDTVSEIAGHAYDKTVKVGEKIYGRVYEDIRHEITGAPVSVQWVTYHGFDKVDGAPSVLSGSVNGDGSTALKLFYTRKKHNVSYEYVDPTSTLTPPATSPRYYGETVPVAPADNTLIGYTFGGWKSVDVDATGATFTMPDKAVHIVGEYKPAEVNYKIKYYFETLTDDDYDEKTEYEVNDTALTGTTVYAPVLSEDKTVGFKYKHESPTQHTAVVAANGSTVLEVYYDRLSYNVKYEWFSPQDPAVNAEYPNPFPADATYKYGQDFSLVAKLADFLYDVNGTVGDTTDDIQYTFNGWYSHNIQLNPETIATTFTMPAHDVTIFASFIGVEPVVDPTVTYDDDTPNPEPAQDDVPHGKYIIVDPNGGSWTHTEVTTDTYTAPVRLEMTGDRTLEAPIRAGYVFTGWQKYEDTTVPNPGNYDLTDVEFVYIAQYKEEITVSYDLNGGTGATGVDYSDKIVAQGSTITVNAAPTKANYTFTGWTSALGAHASGDTVVVNADITFVAQWSRDGGGGGGITRYTLTYETNGGNNIAKETYSSGTTVKLTKVPVKEGYVFEGWHLDETLTEDVTEVKMTKNITVYAAWVEDNGSAGNGHKTPDALNGEDHFAYVIGYPDGTVKPSANITRAEVTSIFFRLLKPDEVRNQNLTENNSFNDVNTEDWYNTAISTMAKIGIVKGRTEDSFVPNAFITRAEFAAICARFDDSEFKVVDNFTDVAGHWAEHDIHEAAAHGWIRGYEDGTFKPDQFITRAEAMTMINRVLNRVPETTDDLHDDMIKWPDNSDKSAWYYLAVQEATNSHDYEMKNHIYEKWTALREATDWTKYE